MKYKNLELHSKAGTSEDYGLLIDLEDVDKSSPALTATDNESSSSRSSSCMSVPRLPPLQRLQPRNMLGSVQSTPAIQSIAMQPVARLDGWTTTPLLSSLSAREVRQLAREEVDRAVFVQSLPHRTLELERQKAAQDRALELERQKAAQAKSSKVSSHEKSDSFFTVSPNLVNCIIPQEVNPTEHKYKRTDRASMVTTVRSLPSPRLFRHEQAKAAQTSYDELVNIDTSSASF